MPSASSVRADPAGELARTPSEQALIESPRLWMAIALAVAALIGFGLLIRQLVVTRRARRRREEEARRPQVTVAGVSASPIPAHADAAGTDAPAFWTPSRPLSADEALANATQAKPAQPVAPPPRPRVTFTLNPRRAGLNLVSATVDAEVTVRNEGDAPAEAIAVGMRLLAVRGHDDDDVSELFRGAPGKPAVPPFVLEPGAERVVRTTLVLPRAEIEPIIVKEQQMFIPLVATDIRYTRPDGGTGQSAAAFVVGAVRPDGEKLAPFWLDRPPTMRDGVEARPHGQAIEI